VGGSSLCENPVLLGPLSHVWVSVFLCCFFFFFFFFFFLVFLFRVFVIVFASAPTSTSTCSLSFSLSLSHYYLSRSLYIALSSLRVSPRMSLR
jgi:hypothetical protein